MLSRLFASIGKLSFGLLTLRIFEELEGVHRTVSYDFNKKIQKSNIFREKISQHSINRRHSSVGTLSAGNRSGEIRRKTSYYN